MREKEVMQSLIESFFKDEISQNFLESVSAPDHLEDRLQVLHYGYEARTRKVLEDNFLNFKQALGAELWLKLGQEFCLHYAFVEEQLGLLPRKFFQWAQSGRLSLDQEQDLALKRDLAHFESRQAFYDQEGVVTDPESLVRSSKIAVQSTLQLVASPKGHWAVSRNRKNFFEIQISERVYDFLRSHQQVIFAPDELETAFSTEQELAHFIVLALSYAWLRLAP